MVKLAKKGDLTICDNYRGISYYPYLLSFFCRVIIDRIRNGIEDKLRPVDILRNIRKIRRSLIRSIGSASEESWRYTDQTRYQISNYTIVQQRSHYQKQPKGDVGNG